MGIPRETILEHLRELIAEKKPIIGSGAGIGLSAKAEEVGGTDLIIVYNSGYFRMQGRPSNAGILPLGDANEMMLTMANQILPVVKNVPVIAGVFAHDSFRNMSTLLDQVKDIGFSGIQNFPTLGDMEGHRREVFYQVGFNYDREVSLIKLAASKDLLTTPFVWTVDDALKMIDAGADIIVIHASMTTGGLNGVSSDAVMDLDSVCEMVQSVRDAAVNARKDIIVLVHGGPIAYPADLEYVLQHTEGIHGFYGASSCERLPVEEGISKRIQEFKNVSF